MIHFMRYKWLYFLISAIVLVPGLFALVIFGLRPSIDFTGGSLLEIKIGTSAASLNIAKNATTSAQINSLTTTESSEGAKKNYPPVNIDDLRTLAEKTGASVGSVQTSGKDTYLFKTKTIDRNKSAEIQKVISEKYGPSEEIRFETVGPLLGQELLEKTFIAALLAAGAILLYVAWAFKNFKFGTSAVLALIHDLLVVVGMFAVFGKILNVEVDSLFVTAVLTTMSFSVHDTIVVFDRIRETRKKNPKIDFEALADKAITETMGRSLNNSLTIIFMLTALVLLGGSSMRWFTAALLIGTISGTYSSPFVATPILVIWQKWEDRKRKANS